MIATVWVVGGREFRADDLTFDGGLWIATGRFVHRDSFGEHAYADQTIALPPRRIEEIRWERPRASS